MIENFVFFLSSVFPHDAWLWGKTLKCLIFNLKYKDLFICNPLHKSSSIESTGHFKLRFQIALVLLDHPNSTPLHPWRLRLLQRTSSNLQFNTHCVFPSCKSIVLFTINKQTDNEQSCVPVLMWKRVKSPFGAKLPCLWWYWTGHYKISLITAIQFGKKG